MLSRYSEGVVTRGVALLEGDVHQALLRLLVRERLDVGHRARAGSCTIPAPLYAQTCRHIVQQHYWPLTKESCTGCAARRAKPAHTCTQHCHRQLCRPHLRRAICRSTRCHIACAVRKGIAAHLLNGTRQVAIREPQQPTVALGGRVMRRATGSPASSRSAWLPQRPAQSPQWQSLQGTRCCCSEGSQAQGSQEFLGMRTITCMRQHL